jgi:DNA-directed RNA polymerase specialized sigma24 family protein
MDKKVVTNEEFEIALNDINNILIMNSVCSSFRKFIDDDELYSCKLMALWQSMIHWKEGGRKFTSFLFQRLKWECVKIMNQKKRNRCYNIEIEKVASVPGYFGETIEVLPNDLQDIIVKRFVYKKTLREIGKEHNMCPETVRRRVFHALKMLKNT